MRLVVATLNPDKLAELGALLGRPDLELVSLADLPGARAPEESHGTLLENARLKARSAAGLSGLPAIADDTGLEVDALGGRPGVHAARYAGPSATYADNVARLLVELEGVPPERRSARFRTVCVLRMPDGREVVGEGVLEGRIAQHPRGTGGFGYDAVFELPELRRTLAELAPREKNARSHRGRAVASLREAMARLGL